MKTGIIYLVQAALKEIGSSTVSEITEYLHHKKIDVTAHTVNTACLTLCKKSKTLGTRAYKSGWRLHQTKAGPRYYRMYSLGKGTCHPKPPKIGSAECNKKYRANMKKRQVVSVFHLGLQMKDHYAIRKERTAIVGKTV